MCSVPTKKRKKDGRISDATKKLRLQSNVTGGDCKCKKLKCFSIISEEARASILREFNSLSSYNEQNSYLAGLITVVPIKRRRPRKPADEINRFNQSSYKYRVRVSYQERGICDVQICFKAFLSIHGVTGRRIQTIQNSLKMTGTSPVDGRGKHKNRKHALSIVTITSVKDHISSFKTRSCHYSLKKTKKKST